MTRGSNKIIFNSNISSSVEKSLLKVPFYYLYNL